MTSFTRRRSCFRYWQSKTPKWAQPGADQRATVVRNRLETEGKVSRERLFLVEPKLTTEGIKDQGAKTRVDFSLK